MRVAAERWSSFSASCQLFWFMKPLTIDAHRHYTDIMTWDDVLAIGFKLPGMEAATSYGTPALKVCGKLVTRLRTEDGSLVLLGVPADERSMLIEADPAIFHITPHYDSYPAVLAYLAALNEHQLWPFLLRRWLDVAPKRVAAKLNLSHEKAFSIAEWL